MEYREDRASANSAALRHYSAVAERIDADARPIAHKLDQIVRHFLTACTEYAVPIDPNFAGPFARLIQRDSDQTAWVRRVALSFDLADRGKLDWLRTANQSASEIARWLARAETALASGGGSVLGASASATTIRRHLLAARILPGGPAFDAAGHLIRTDLTVEEFEILTADERIQWVLEMERLVERGPWFHNIIDIIRFFGESSTLHNLEPYSWASWADAGVLEAIQNGWVLSKKEMPVSLSGGAAEKWKHFIDKIRDPQFNINDLTHDLPQAKSLWAIAEQTGVNYGVRIADDPIHGGRPGGLEGEMLKNFTAAANLYRAIARIPNGGGMVGTAIGGEIGHESGNMGGIIVDSLVFPWIPFGQGPGKPIGGAVGAWAGAGTGSERGEWFTDPRSTMDVPAGGLIAPPSWPPLFPPPTKPIPIMPGTHGPTYYSAKTAEALTIEYPGGIPLPPGATIRPNGTLVFPNGTTIDPSGTIVTADGTVINPDGSIRGSNGTFFPTPDGTVINPDGTLTLPDGFRTR